ncbi:MAG: HAMP domain-containing protein, partial [Deltaproteobacteria bacterium]
MAGKDEALFRIGKFEWKILAALLVTAATPLVFTATIVNRLVRDSMAVGVNDRVLGGLRTGVELYKQVVELKLKLARVQAELLMGDKHFVEALKDGNTGYLEQRLEGVVAASEIVAEARLFARGELVASASRVGDFSPKKYKSKTESWSLEGDARLEFDLAMERDFLESSARLRDLVETLDQLKKNFGPWQMAYYRLFLFIYVWILAISVVVAILLARSVTKRVSRLVQATMQAAAGNLDIRVPVRGRDEIGHLSASFN